MTPFDFNTAMEKLGPYENAPHVAVALSGGGDSMALAMLLKDWADARGGRLTALTVDHGLRDGSAEEAAQVAAWMEKHGIDHRILAWKGAKPETGVQAAARQARYDLLLRWCRDHGVLHLATAHNREDQAETHVMRAARGSGPDGLAGIPHVTERRFCRIVRPVLTLSRAALRDICRKAGQPWIEDPSNADERFRRARLREEGIDHDAVLAEVADHARARRKNEIAAARRMARHAALYAQGYALLDVAGWRALDRDMRLRVLSALLIAVSGDVYPPRSERLVALDGLMVEGKFSGRTLHGCGVYPASKGRFLICREAAAASEIIALQPGREALWDNRYRVKTVSESLEIRALGTKGCAFLRDMYEKNSAGEARFDALPHRVRLALPAFWNKQVPVFVPYLWESGEGGGGLHFAAFSPARPACGPAIEIV